MNSSIDIEQLNQYENRFFARIGQSVTLFALITNEENGRPLATNSVTAADYSIWPLGTIDERRKKPVRGHDQSPVPLTALFAAPIASAAMPEGYNFRFAPPNRVYPLFPSAGRYDLLVKLYRGENNPMTFVYRFDVE